MSFTTACPNCDARLQAPDTVEGKRVKCKKCGEAFVARPVEEEDDDRPARPAKAAAKTRPRPVADDEDDRPRRPSKASRRDDDEDDDRPRRRSRDDEDDEPRPKATKKGKKRKKPVGAPVLLFVLIGVGALVLIGGGITAYVLLSDDKAPENPAPKGGPGGPAGPGAVAAGGGLAAGWPETHEPGGQYRVRFPSPPQAQTQQMAGVSIKVYLSGGQNEVFASAHEPLRPERRGALTDAQVLDQAGQMAVRMAKGANIANTREISYQGYAGRELTMNVAGKQGQFIMRVIVAKDRLILLMAGGDTASPDAPRVKAFFESLKIE
jgi:hypothetical protein